MALKIQVSFKETKVEEIKMYNFVKEKGEIIGESGYIKSLIKKAMDEEAKVEQ